MPRTSPGSSPGLTYRPALDGLRGIAVLAVLTFHLAPDALPGGWLGVDLFFVLSGFLITTLLVREFVDAGRIDLVSFWKRRLRRLAPPLVVMLLGVVLASLVWTLPSRREATAWDIISSLFYVSNWRFLFSDEAYFGAVTSPSPVRHTWSLAIEEQYYLFFPLILLTLAAIFHRRRQLALAIAALAAVSVAWMVHLYTPGVDPTRIYFGTDTRAFELLIGAAAGAWVGPAQWGHRARAGWVASMEIVAWPALCGVIAAFFVFSENDAALFRGGMAALCVAALAPILAAASPHPNTFQRVLSVEPLRLLGLISYSLYLWHWPVRVFFTPGHTHLDGAALTLLQVATSLLLAAASYWLIERPIRRGGLGALVPSRPLAARILGGLTALGVVVGAMILPRTQSSAAASDAGTTGPNLMFTAPSYRPGADSKTVTFVGNSIPASLANDNYPAATYPDLRLFAAVSFGCTAYVGQEIVDGKPATVSAECEKFQKIWADNLHDADVAAYFVPQNLLNPYEVDGKKVSPGTRAHDDFVRSTLDYVQSKVRGAGVPKLAVVTLACHQVASDGVGSSSKTWNDTERVSHLRDVTVRWARDHGATLIDQYGFLCDGGTYHGTMNGTPLYADGVHFTHASAPIFWSWLAPQLQKAAR